MNPSKAVLEPFREPRADDFKIERDPQPHPEMIDARTVRPAAPSSSGTDEAGRHMRRARAEAG